MNHLVLKATGTKRRGFSSSSNSPSSTPCDRTSLSYCSCDSPNSHRDNPPLTPTPTPSRRCDIRHPGCQQKWEAGWNAKPFPLWSSVTSLAYWNAFSTSYLSGPCKHPIISNHFPVRSATALHFSHAMWSIPFFWHPGKSYLMISKGGNVSCQRRLPENSVWEHQKGP